MGRSRGRVSGVVRAAGWMIAGGMAAIFSLVAPLGAQGVPDTTDAEASIGCWQGQPLPECRSFWLFEVQGNLLLSGSDRTVVQPDARIRSRESFESSLEWNLGHMVNVSDRVALGGMVSLGTGSSDVFTGLKGRARWWLHQDYSVELGAGGMKTDLTGSFAGDDLWGVTTDFRINIQDRGSFFLRWEGVDVPTSTRLGVPDPDGPSDFGNAIYAGVGLGSDWAAIGTAAGGLGYLVLLGVVLSGLE